MSIGPAIALAAVAGLALGIVIALITDVPWPPRLGGARCAGRLVLASGRA